MIEWSKCFGGSALDTAEFTAEAIRQTPDGGYIVAGTSYSTDSDLASLFHHGGSDYWIVRIDIGGAIRWSINLGGSGLDEAHSIQQTSDGGYIVAGSSASPDEIGGDVTGNHGTYDYWVVTLDENGEIAWEKSLGGTGDDFAYSIQQTLDLGYIVAGSSTSRNGNVTGNHGGSDYWVVKLRANGNIEWQKSLGGTEADEARSIQQTSDGGYIVAGWSSSIFGEVTGNHGGSDYWVVKLNADGTIDWKECLGGTGDDNATFIQQTLDGGYIVAGWSFSSGPAESPELPNGNVSGHHGGSDYWVVKLGADGGILWQKCLGGAGLDNANAIYQASVGGYVVTGSSFSDDGDVEDAGNHGGGDYWVVKLGPDGSGEDPVVVDPGSGNTGDGNTGDSDPVIVDPGSGDPESASMGCDAGLGAVGLLAMAWAAAAITSRKRR
jgi:hypothetical protein